MRKKEPSSAILSTAAGWAFGWFIFPLGLAINIALRTADGNTVVLPVIMGVGWAIGALITSLTMYRANLSLKKKHILVIVFGWAISGLIIGWKIMNASDILFWVGWIMGGVPGGILIAVTMRWADPMLEWSQVVGVAMVWMIGWAGAFFGVIIIGGLLGFIFGYDEVGSAVAIVISFPIGGAIAGIVGGTITFLPSNSSASRPAASDF